MFTRCYEVIADQQFSRVEPCGTTFNETVFHFGILDNVTFFASQADMQRAHECVRMAAIKDDTLAMPMSWHTLIGDMGAALSGGQKQRLLLARALYKQPGILFLDEATSHLDTACEHLVNEAVRSLTLTKIVIAHRTETIKSADRVIELKSRLEPSAESEDNLAFG